MFTRQPVYMQRNIETCLHNHCCSGKAVRVKYYEHVSVFLLSLPGMQMSYFLHHIILSSVACPTLPYFPTLSHKGHDFGENVTEYKVYVFIFPATFV